MCGRERKLEREGKGERERERGKEREGKRERERERNIYSIYVRNRL